MSEKLVADVSDLIKVFNRDKSMISKKLIEFFQTRYIDEFSKCYSDLLEKKTAYDKYAKDAEAYKSKYEDAIKPKKSALSVFTSGGGDNVEKVEKLRKKWVSTGRQMDEARNEYLLALEAMNHAQSQYYTADLPNLMKTLDGAYYTVLPNLLDRYAQMEMEYSSSLKSFMDSLKVRIDKVDRDHELTLFLQDRKLLFDTPAAVFFQSHPSDSQRDVVIDEFTKVILSNKLGEWMNKELETAREITKREKQISGLEQMVAVYSKTPEFGDAQNPLEEKMDLEMDVYVFKLVHVQCMAAISKLKGMGITYSEPLTLQVSAPMASPLDSGNHSLSGSRPSSLFSAGSSRMSQAMMMQQQQPPSQSQSQFQQRAAVLHAYDSQAADQLSIQPGEELNVIERVAGGWCKVTHVGSSIVGLVPESYISIGGSGGGGGGGGSPYATVTAATTTSTISSTTNNNNNSSNNNNNSTVRALYDYNATDSAELSFQRDDIIQVVSISSQDNGDEDWWEGVNTRTGKSGTFPVVFTAGWEQVKKNSSVKKSTNALASRHSLAGGKSNNNLVSSMNNVSSSSKDRARALYGYEATCDGELSFKAGDVIVVTEKNTGSSAWWEGEVEGRPGVRGQFPVSYVEVFGNSTTTSNSGAAAGTRSSSNSVSNKMRVRALYPYSGQGSDELTLVEGDVIIVTKSPDNDDWWEGSLRGKTGVFPRNYVDII